MNARALLSFLAAGLAASCMPPHMRQTTVGDARPPDRWLEGARCSELDRGGDVRVEIVEAGIGSPVVAGETVRIHYVATLPTGETLHDTHEGPPHELVVGSTRTICGFEKGLAGMRPGEQRRVFVPAALAFGDGGRAPEGRPPSDLVFLIDLWLPAGVDATPGGSPGRPAAGGGGRRR